MTNATFVPTRCAQHSELDSLVTFSAEIGANRLLVQASGGNTSLKIDDTLWVKASGKWLVSATDSEILVPVNLSFARDCVKRGRPLDGSAVKQTRVNMELRPSIETLMHAALPHPVVAHVHSINSIAWVIRQDAHSRLTERLAGLRWHWVPYCSSGLPLAQAVAAHPGKEVFLLGNHGLVLCGESCGDVKNLLEDVERRLETPPRHSPGPRMRILEQFENLTGWPIAGSDLIHSLGTDPVARHIAKSGILYPCQAIFLGRKFPLFPCSQPLSSLRVDSFGASPFLSVEGCGVLLNPRITNAEYAILEGFAEVLARTSAATALRYLSHDEVEALTGGVSLQYRSSGDNRSLKW